MKHYQKIVMAVLLLTIIVSCAKKENKTTIQKPDNSITISGEVKGMGDTIFFMRYPDLSKEKKYRNDSIVVKNGKFIYKDSIDHFTILRLFPMVKRIAKTAKGGGYYPIASNRLPIIIFPGANVKINGEITDYVNAYPSGDPENELLAELHKEINPTLNEVGSLLSSISFETDKVKIKKMRKEMKVLEDKVAKTKEKFIHEHPSSIAGIYYLEDMITRSDIDEDNAFKLFEKIDPKSKDNIYYKNLEKRIAGITATKPGQPVPEIKTTSTLDGKEFDLNSYKGKYVMIDFWGTWCSPCVGEMPHVKKYLAKHKDKIEVLGVNSGDTKKRLQSFIEKNDYNWQQVLNVRGDSPDNFVAKFNVTAFPTKFIIGPDGKILLKYVGDGNEPFDFLEKLLK